MAGKFIITFVVVLLSFFLISNSATAKFNDGYIRLDSQQANTGTKGLICINPFSVSGVENKISIEFPDDFVLSQNLAVWTTSINSLPFGATAMPGIGTAISVSGRIVTFPIANLNAGTPYCFRWNSSAAVTTPPTGENKIGSIKTLSSSNTVIDASNISISVVSNNQISISADVPANSSDAEVKMTASPSISDSLDKGTEITFTIEYRSLLPGAGKFSLTSAWQRGEVSGSSTNLAEVLQYVVGSGTAAAGGEAPVVNFLDRSITWNIPALTSTSSWNKVSYKLRVLDYSSSKNAVAKITTGGIIHDTTIIPTLLSVKINGLSGSAGSSSTSPSATPTTATITATPTPTGPPAIVKFESIKTVSISDAYADLAFTTSRPSTCSVAYGATATNLNKTHAVTNEDVTHTVRLVELEASTLYYLKIKCKGNLGNTISSDLFTLTTATKGTEFIVNQADTSILWKKLPLTSESTNEVVTTKATPLTITIQVPDGSIVKNVFATIKSKNVLGISTADQEPKTTETKLTEILPNTFSGELLTPEESGSYKVQVDIFDIYGGFAQKTLPYEINNTNPIKIVDKKTEKPIVGAGIKLSIYNGRTKLYQQVDESFKLPLSSDENGEMKVVLPYGQYQIVVDAEGYKIHTTTFNLDQKKEYPTIKLESESGIIHNITSIKQSGEALSGFFGDIIQSLSTSKRAQNAIFIFNMVLSVIMVAMLTIEDALNAQRKNRFLSFIFWIIEINYLVIFDILIMITFFVSILFALQFDYVRSLSLFSLAFLNISMWFIYVRRFWFSFKRAAA